MSLTLLGAGLGGTVKLLVIGTVCVWLLVSIIAIFSKRD